MKTKHYFSNKGTLMCREMTFSGTVSNPRITGKIYSLGVSA